MSVEELDLSCADDDPDMGIPAGGFWCEDPDKETQAEIEKVKESVKKINLENQGELKTVPHVIASCANLEELNLAYTGITEIPEFVFRLPKLRSLSYNSCYDLKEHPANCADAKNLEQLKLDIWEKKTLPKGITELPSLKILEINGDCVFESLPGNVGD
ncbi:MAG: hypothetical protein LBR96_02925, partial [Treponema sp.]|nr:hypothetical protein [Treponema sp.]